MDAPFPTPLEGDSAELATALHCVSAQWERGDRQAAVASLADAVLIAEGEGRPDRASNLARGLARLALAARQSEMRGSGERPAVRPTAIAAPVASPAPARKPAQPAPAPPKSTVSGERPAVTARLMGAEKAGPEGPDSDPFLFNGWSDSEIPGRREDVVTARLPPEVIAAARARMRVPTADAFRPLAPVENPTLRPPGRDGLESLDLGGIPPFSELPEDIRRELAVAAEMQVIAEGQELTAFALALVLNGSVDALSEVESFSPQRYDAGSVVSGQRLRAASGTASLAIWRSSALDSVLAAFPSVRAKLSAA